jgi:hypothetical protein
MQPRLVPILALAAMAAGPASAASAEWRRDASPDDVRRLERIDQAWTQALRAAPGGSPAKLKALGALADPEAALPSRPEPTPGTYRCRTVKLGPGGGSGAGLTAYGWFTCKVALSPGGDLTLTKTTGSQRPMGHLYPDSRRRLVYLGAVAWGQEGPAVYGRDPERDQIGVVERIGPQRWRLVLPFPKQESTLDLIELRR